MKRNLRSRGLACAGLVLAGAIGSGLALGRIGSGRKAFSASPAAPPAPELVELALGCLGAGEVRPALAALTDAELDEIVVILARLIGAYAHGDFESFLALRAGDLAFAAHARRDDVGELASFCRQLGIPAAELPDDWNGLVASYWRAYYVTLPIARIRPEASVVELHREGLQARPLDAWERAFEALCAGREGQRTNHRLVIPHRRPIERVAADYGALRWLDLQLGFEAPDGAEGLLIVRFVWDGAVQEWFLHRATTILDGEHRDERRLLVL